MGRHLNRAKRHFGTDTRGLLEGGRYALLHTRSMEFDDLRPYVPGDDVRDIDWKATARSGTVLIKRFVSERHHKILLVADAGRNMTALAAGGEVKCDVAVAVLGAFGLITAGRADEIGMVYGDSSGCAAVRNRRGETHVESMLDRFYRHVTGRPEPSDIVSQLRYVADHYRHPLLVVVVSDEPDVDDRLAEVVGRVAARHEVLWVMVSDMPAVSGDVDGYDVASGRFVPGGARLGPRLAAAYLRAEQQRRQRIEAFLTGHAIPFAAIGGSAGIRPGLVAIAEVYARAG